MDFTTILNVYCRKIGIWFLSIIPIVLAFSLIILSFSSSVNSTYNAILLFTGILYIVLILVAIPFALNGFFMERVFNAEIKRIINSGLLVHGIEGFNEVKSKIKLLYRGSYSVTISVLISFCVFLSVRLIESSAEFAGLARFFIFVASIGLLAISSGASMLLKLPDKSAIQPGGLMKYYSPRSLTMKLDNLLTDSIIPQLDPITRIQMDDWSKTIFNAMNPEFLPEYDDQIRLERAREKIFLLVYLLEDIPDLMSEEIFISEMKEIIKTEHYDNFIEGKSSKISIKTLKTIIQDVTEEIPAVFDIVQRIFVLVSDNLHLLQTKQEFITISHPNVHIGNIDPFRIITFILNLQEIPRKVRLQVQTSMDGVDPYDASQSLLLDSNNIKIPTTDQKLKFSSTNDPIDVLRLVSSILQVGDAINLQFRPNRTGTHVLNISVDDEDGIIAGRSIVISVQRDLIFYAKSMGAKVLGYAGAAVSFIGIGLGSFAGLINF
jgi:hypothetical protein